MSNPSSPSPKKDSLYVDIPVENSPLAEPTISNSKKKSYLGILLLLAVGLAFYAAIEIYRYRQATEVVIPLEPPEVFTYLSY